MATGYVIYNQHSGTFENTDSIKRLHDIFDGELVHISVDNISSYKVFFDGLDADDYVIICGGDGTLNCFVNNIKDIDIKNDILYLPTGTGNDFALDIGAKSGEPPININEYIKGLPHVTVGGKEYSFVNGVGYGVDGYCCEVGDKLRGKGKKKINYAQIAVKGLLFGYKPTNATVTVDGVKHEYKKVWLAPTMYGRFYGGGMLPAPSQKRGSSKVSVMVFHGTGKLRTLIYFPSIFKGEHVKHKKSVSVIEGKEITVEFDRPSPLQIDGETVLGIRTYTVKI